MNCKKGRSCHYPGERLCGRAAQTPAGLYRRSGKGVLRVGMSQVMARAKNTGNRKSAHFNLSPGEGRQRGRPSPVASE